MSGASFNLWEIAPRQVRYESDEYHTLSIYLEGGADSYRVDQRSNKSAPGSICLMPQCHQSEWRVAAKLSFAHLYLKDNLLKEFFSLNFDADARFAELTDVTYAEDSVLQDALQAMLRSAAHKKLCLPRSTCVQSSTICFVVTTLILNMKSRSKAA